MLLSLFFQRVPLSLESRLLGPVDLVQETKPAKTRCEEEEESPNHPKLLVGRLYLEARDYAGLSKGVLNTHHHLYPVLKTVSSSHHHSRRAGSNKIAFVKIYKKTILIKAPSIKLECIQ